MPTTKKQQIRGIRILLTVFYGFLLSSILFRYIIHGIIETVRRPTNVYAIIMIVLGVLFLVSIGLSIYATWYDQLMILLVSNIVLIFVFILTLTFGIIRIIHAIPHGAGSTATASKFILTDDDSSNAGRSKSDDNVTYTSDAYLLAENTTKLIIELVLILFAILATFILHRYIKTKYAPVSTNEPKA